MVREAVGTRNYHVKIAFSGEQGLHYYLSQGPTTWDFVLSDYRFIPFNKQNGLQPVVSREPGYQPAATDGDSYQQENGLSPVPVLHKPYQSVSCCDSCASP